MDLFVPCCKKKKAFCVVDITNQRVGRKGEGDELPMVSSGAGIVWLECVWQTRPGSCGGAAAVTPKVHRCLQEKRNEKK